MLPSLPTACAMSGCCILWKQGEAQAARSRGVKAGRERRPAVQLPVFTHHQVPTVHVKVGRCSICSRPAFRPVPMQAEGKADAPPPQTQVSAQPTRYLKFKGCSEQIKGQKIADTICLGEANCKQFCYSTAFYLNADTGWIPLLERSAGTGCT